MAPYLSASFDAPADELALKIAADLDDDNRSEALIAALIFYLARRRPAFSASPKRARSVETMSPPSDPIPAMPGASYRSRAATAWRNRLTETVVVGGQPKRLSVCTVMDLRLLARAAADESASLALASRVYSGLADALGAIGARRVNQLPELTLRSLLSQTPPPEPRPQERFARREGA